MASFQFPELPVPVKDFIPYLSMHPETPVSTLLAPFKAYENELRKVYAQEPQHESVQDGTVNLVPVFAGHADEVTIRARDLDQESDEQKAKYVMPLSKNDRKPNGSSAIVSSLREMQDHLNLFSEGSLSDLNWSNVVACGSSVTTALLAVPEKWKGSKRALREYYHEHLAPASDVDLFLYGLDEKQAIEKIKEIERSVQDATLHETVTIRTKNAITIVSQYPQRHVQIVLRLYDSISQIITGFDVDCACVAYDGKQVYAAPRALTAFMTQINEVDLARRSPSYENRLSKYAHRGFEIYWPSLDRSRVDPTIFERSFSHTNGLARLLVLEKLPKQRDREAYMDQRRRERGRPDANRDHRHKLYGNIKDQQEDDVAEWITDDDVSSYTTMVVPYGPKYNASKITKLLFAKDLLLNADWNKSDDREVNLHRHPCFFGDAEDIIGDCCGSCPLPVTDEEIQVAEEEAKRYVSGSLTFVKDDPGRQEIGSFNPITEGDWTDMAYVGNTQMLCQAIVDGDVDYVESWCSQEGNDPNMRDYTGRTPLHLACMCSSVEVVQSLLDHGARMVARLIDGKTSLHIAAARGDVSIVSALMTKSMSNQEEEDEREEERKAARKAALGKSTTDLEGGSEAEDLGDSNTDDEDSDSMTQGSFVKVGSKSKKDSLDDILDRNDENDPDILDIEVAAWDYPVTALHLAILNGHTEVIRTLVDDFGADVLAPVRPAGIISLVLAYALPIEKAKKVVQTLLEVGASLSQADLNQFTALHYAITENNLEILKLLFRDDAPAAKAALNYVAVRNGSHWDGGIDTALVLGVKGGKSDMVSQLLAFGALPTISYDDYIKSAMAHIYSAKHNTPEQNKKDFDKHCWQPIVGAAYDERGEILEQLIAAGADPNALSPNTLSTIHAIQSGQSIGYWEGESVLDMVRKSLRALRDYDGENFGAKEPSELEDFAVFAGDIQKGTYEHFVATGSYETEKSSRKKSLDEYLRQRQEAKDSGYMVPEKRKAIATRIQELERAEKALEKAGAQPFNELYPEHVKEKPKDRAPSHKRPGWGNGSNQLKFAISFTFRVPEMTATQHNGYMQIFEAAWTNDVDSVKRLTLGTWDSVGDEQYSPLKVAVTDANGFSPFSIAVLRRHRDLANAILEIALAQYQPRGADPRRRFTIRGGDAYDSDSDSGSVVLESELADKNFSMNDIGAVSNVVQSDVRPVNMIAWKCPTSWLRDDNQYNGGHNSLLEYAVEKDDLALVKWILKTGRQQASILPTDDAIKCYNPGEDVFNLAMRLGRADIMSELIRSSGVGIPLDEIVKESGLEIKQTSDFYQGLTVRGRKRQDWANKQRGISDGFFHNAAKNPPLLEAARLGNVESVKYFMSTTPQRQYEEFAKANQADGRIKALAESGYGFDKLVGKWLGARSDLVLHCAVLASDWGSDKGNDLIQHLLTVSPELMEKKSMEGWTPLHVAVTMHKSFAVKLLIKHGADQRVRDKLGRNIVHHAIRPLGNVSSSGSMLRDFGQAAIKEMLLERCSESPSNLTPLALWMNTIMCGAEHEVEMLEWLHSYTSGTDLEIMNGQGDLLLHVAVRKSVWKLVAWFMEKSPHLMLRENASGRTPVELSWDMLLQEKMQHPPGRGRSYGMHARNDRKLVDKHPHEFQERGESNHSRKKTWEICVAFVERMEKGEGLGKRKLVSLNECNLVAERLASRKVRSDGGDGEGEERKKDEVSEWMDLNPRVWRRY